MLESATKSAMIIAFCANALMTGVVTNASAHGLPLGDGRVTDHPSVGNVFSCQTTFREGRRHDGPWFHGDTWDPAAKPHVEGSILWPEATFALVARGGDLAVEGNGLPVGQPTGRFPISPTDPAFQYDTNPNAIEAHDLAFEIPLAPARAEAPGCLPMGMVGFTTTGVAIYNALDDAGRDAAAHEIQDLCDGHPQGRGQYHYHSSSPCLPGADASTHVGWALDGYPILGMRDANGALLSNLDLDACHGREETAQVDGRTYQYVYRLTQEYPYTLGCFTGLVSASTREDIRQSLGPPRGREQDGRPLRRR